MTRNTIEARPRGPNQPTKSDRQWLEAGTCQCDGDRRHADDGQAQQRIDDDLDISKVSPKLACHGQAERGPYPDGQQVALRLGEAHGVLLAQVSAECKREPTNEGGDEAVAPRPTASR